MYAKVHKKRIGAKCPVCLDVPWDSRDSTPRLELNLLQPMSEITPVKKNIIVIGNPKNIRK